MAGVNPSASDAVTILYTNYRNETAVRRITPIAREWFGSSDWHPEPQWLFSAYDMDKEVFRDFARAGVKAWGQAAVDAALASPRADSDERTAGRSAVAQALRAAEWGGVSIGNKALIAAAISELEATPAQPAGAVPDSLRALSEAVREYGKAEWSAGYATGSYGEGPNPDVTDRLSNVLNSLSLLIASHPAGQSAGSGADLFEASRRLIVEWGDAPELPEEMENALTRFEKVWLALDDGKPAPDSTRTGQAPDGWVLAPVEPTEEMLEAFCDAHRERWDAVRSIGYRPGPGDVAKTCYAAALAARPAAPEARGACPTLPMSYHLMCEEERRLHTVMGVAATWHDDQAKALSKQPPGGARDWQRLEHEEQARLLREDRIAPPASSGQGER